MLQIGDMRERLVILDPTPQAVSVSSLTRTGATATATTPAPHGYTTGDYVTVAGASPDGYNRRVKVTVTGPTTFVFAVDSGLATPATGTITATYASDAQGGRAPAWRTLDTIPAALEPVSAAERLQAQAVGSTVRLRFRVRARGDVRPKMRALWTPSYQPAAQRHELEIGGVLPVRGEPHWMVLECGEWQ